MRVVYLHQYFTPPCQPGGVRSYEMARLLVAWSHQVDMTTSRREEGELVRGWYQTEEAGIQVHWLPVPYSNRIHDNNDISSC